MQFRSLELFGIPEKYHVTHQQNMLQVEVKRTYWETVYGGPWTESEF